MYMKYIFRAQFRGAVMNNRTDSKNMRLNIRALSKELNAGI